MSHVTSKSILKHKVNFDVDSDGKFYATILNEDGSESRLTSRYDTLNRTIREARNELKKEQVRVAVPFTYVDRPLNSRPPAMHTAIARGRHARDRHLILIWIDDGTEKGRTDTISSYWARETTVLKDGIPKKDLGRIRALFTLRQRTQDRLNRVNKLITDWIQEHSFDLASAVDEAIKEAQAEQGEREEAQSP